jgi:hypothetical protein
VRLQVARWQVDDHPPAPTLVHRRQLRGDDRDMPVHGEIGLRVEVAKRALGKASEIGAQ